MATLTRCSSNSLKSETRFEFKNNSISAALISIMKSVLKAILTCICRQGLQSIAPWDRAASLFPLVWLFGNIGHPLRSNWTFRVLVYTRSALTRHPTWTNWFETGVSIVTFNRFVFRVTFKNCRISDGRGTKIPHSAILIAPYVNASRINVTCPFWVAKGPLQCRGLIMVSFKLLFS